ncbi:hypothetical protein GCM10023185_18980 [Hymenobacter saemangeumensis]|uniref:Uncharacterized protein n=1 Tax=Hymenobacter saemangeumensis TaxID=1084522 RepID=A0ABP8IC96_9BACT
MYFPVLYRGWQRLCCWVAYGIFQLALWAAFGLHNVGSLRSALGGGGGADGERAARPIKPRLYRPARRDGFPFPTTA